MKIHTVKDDTVKDGSDRSIINGTLLEEQRVFSAISRLPVEGFS